MAGALHFAIVSEALSPATHPRGFGCDVGREPSHGFAHLDADLTLICRMPDSLDEAGRFQPLQH
jgi:hypothetical protein